MNVSKSLNKSLNLHIKVGNFIAISIVILLLLFLDYFRKEFIYKFYTRIVL
jgi:hypothetical protein